MLRCIGNLQAEGEIRGVGTGHGLPAPAEQDAETEPTCDLFQSLKHSELLRLKRGGVGGWVAGGIRRSQQGQEQGGHHSQHWPCQPLPTVNAFTQTLCPSSPAVPILGFKAQALVWQHLSKQYLYPLI